MEGTRSKALGTVHEVDLQLSDPWSSVSLSNLNLAVSPLPRTLGGAISATERSVGFCPASDADLPVPQLILALSTLPNVLGGVPIKVERADVFGRRRVFWLAGRRSAEALTRRQVS